MKTIFKEGDRVFDQDYGWGSVKHIKKDNAFPIKVEYNKEFNMTYTEDGKPFLESVPKLSFTEYTLQGFSQERPMTLPEVGEMILVANAYTGPVTVTPWVTAYFKDYIPFDSYPVKVKDYLGTTYEYNHFKRFQIIE